MATKDIIEIAKQSLSALEKTLNKKPESVISVNKEGKVWKVIAEVLERKAVPDTQDLLGRYELSMDDNGELLGYKQIMTKKRADLWIEE